MVIDKTPGNHQQLFDKSMPLIWYIK